MKIYENSYKALTSAKPLRFRFDKIGGFIRICGGEIRYSVLFNYGWFDNICDRVKYLISEEIDITDIVNHNIGKIRIDSYNYLPIEKILTFHKVIMLFTSVVNENKNEYYYNIFLEKGSHKDKSATLSNLIIWLYIINAIFQ